MTESRGPERRRFPRTIREAYAFACLSCGHAWEQAYEIEHHVDAADRPFFLYFAEGQRVPSPLVRLTCLNCDEHKVRIVGTGQVEATGSTPAPPGSPRSTTPPR
ncbi:hypothetical protein QNO07_21800 [Streptomyces sp. 549]|uniref:hypothetical protein n=1 Tax=Streptomyces sp. 549 TaxID=3049076 RepID=UPI0024C2258D|nr:hypothetical protein [Streptomyces sp. 549]MDK1476019.1 hypothetical protein [Streptomyces sp. 549]